MLAHLAPLEWQSGEPLSLLASGFLASPEFQARFGGATAGNGAFVDQFYLNLLGRAGEAEGRAFWVGTLEGAAATRADVLAAFSEGAANQTGTADLVQSRTASSPAEFGILFA